MTGKPGLTDTQNGQSGNPGGKPKAIIEVARAARHTRPKRWKSSCIARDTKATTAARVTASQYVVDRGGACPKESDR